MPVIALWSIAVASATSLVRRVERDDQGSVVEKVILTAIFAALAIAAGAIIVAKVTAKANSINLG
jgi:cell division protein FtsL